MTRTDIYFIIGLILLALGVLVDVIISGIIAANEARYDVTVPIYYYVIPVAAVILGILTLQKNN